MKALQLIDSLHAGGAERVAINFANSLANELDESFICATREEGLLKQSINANVKYLFLNKTKTIDLKAIFKLNKFINNHKIDIIHAHSSSFFLATIIKFFNKRIKIIWHDHYGNSEFLDKRKSKILQFCSKYFSHVFCVNKNLEAWAKRYLKIEEVSYLPNFAVKSNAKPETNLFGVLGKRVVCLANLRPQKDHLTLLTAFRDVVQKHPDWTLHCVGKDFKDEYSSILKEKIKTLDLSNNVYLYGSKPDISNILSQCQIGILSSKSEGLPIALLEYGLSKLAVITTKVGECEEVIGSEKNGILIQPENANELKNACFDLIENDEKRVELANRFNLRVVKEYSSRAALKKVLMVYKAPN